MTGKSSKERVAAHAARLRAAGLVPVTLWVPAAAAADFKQAGELCRQYPHLTLARLADRQTGKLTGLKGCKS